MAYNRTISVQGVEQIEGKTVKINFTYTPETPPTRVSFSIDAVDGITIYGSCTKTEIENYNVSGGIVTDEFMTLVKAKCIAALEGYETI